MYYFRFPQAVNVPDFLAQLLRRWDGSPVAQRHLTGLTPECQKNYTFLGGRESFLLTVWSSIILLYPQEQPQQICPEPWLHCPGCTALAAVRGQAPACCREALFSSPPGSHFSGGLLGFFSVVRQHRGLFKWETHMWRHTVFLQILSQPLAGYSSGT